MPLVNRNSSPAPAAKYVTQPSDDDMFATPSDLPKGGTKIADLDGELVIMRVTGDEIEMETSMGEGVARPVEVLVVNGDKPEWQEMLVFSAGIKAQLGAAARSNKPIVGVIGKGTAKPGKSAPWLVLDPTAEQVSAAREVFVRAGSPF